MAEVLFVDNTSVISAVKAGIASGDSGAAVRFLNDLIPQGQVIHINDILRDEYLKEFAPSHPAYVESTIIRPWAQAAILDGRIEVHNLTPAQRAEYYKVPNDPESGFKKDSAEKSLLKYTMKDPAVVPEGSTIKFGTVTVHLFPVENDI
jgi:hypothetical protein